MLAVRHSPNTLQAFVKENNLESRSFTAAYVRLSLSVINNFPRLDPITIQVYVTAGSYQLAQSRSYLAEYKVSSRDRAMVCIDSVIGSDAGLIYCKINSRFRSVTKHHVYVKYKPFVNEISRLLGWYCTCPVGARTVGCCSHIAVIIYYFAYEKFQPESTNPASHLMNIFPSGIYVENSSSDESGNEAEENDEADEPANNTPTGYSSIKDHPLYRSKDTVKVIKTKFHQSNVEIFGDNSGKQCTAMCASAIAATQVLAPNQWTTETLNQILIRGNSLYTVSLITTKVLL